MLPEHDFTHFLQQFNGIIRTYACDTIQNTSHKLMNRHVERPQTMAGCLPESNVSTPPFHALIFTSRAINDQTSAIMEGFARRMWYKVLGSMSPWGTSKRLHMCRDITLTTPLHPPEYHSKLILRSSVGIQAQRFAQEWANSAAQRREHWVGPAAQRQLVVPTFVGLATSHRL